MLELADISLALPTPVYKEQRKLQRDRLSELENQVFQKKLPVIIVFEGWDASGKGNVIRELTRRLDPRGFKVYQTQAPRTLEKKRPWLWRFWMQVPRRGQIAIFDRSWYGRVLVERVESLVSIPDWIRAYQEINHFERTLAADGTIFIKFFLHVSEAEQLARFIRLSDDPMTAWEISAEDWENHRKYKEYEAAVKDMLENTHTSYAPWSVVPATDQNFCNHQVYRILINTLEAQLGIAQTPWAIKTAKKSTQKAASSKQSKKKTKTKREAHDA